MANQFCIQKFELKILSIFLLILSLANIINLIAGMPFWPITRLIYLGVDDNAAAWFSSILLFVGSIIAYDCWKVAVYQNLKNRFLILTFAFLLLFMSLDELARIHETLGGDLAKFTGLNQLSIAKNANWVWFGGPVILLIFGFVVFSLKGLFENTGKSFTYLIWGLITIVIGGVFLEAFTNFLNHEEDKLIWAIEIIVEETLEMAGSMLICYSLILWRDVRLNSGTN